MIFFHFITCSPQINSLSPPRAVVQLAGERRVPPQSDDVPRARHHHRRRGAQPVPGRQPPRTEVREAALVLVVSRGKEAKSFRIILDYP